MLTLARLPSPLGELLLLVDGQGALCALDFADFESRMRELLRRHRPGCQLSPGPVPPGLATALEGYFAGELKALNPVKVAAAGTDFQRLVWAGLCSIPPGETRSYGELASQLGRPAASRAVGLANSQNPVAIVIPCHRVIGSKGKLTGYAGGLERKRFLLEHERRHAGFALRAPSSTVGR